LGGGDLAKEVALSRSAFVVRFTTLVGVPVCIIATNVSPLDLSD
jgi:hypothetical protein